MTVNRRPVVPPRHQSAPVLTTGVTGLTQLGSTHQLPAASAYAGNPIGKLGQDLLIRHGVRSPKAGGSKHRLAQALLPGAASGVTQLAPLQRSPRAARSPRRDFRSRLMASMMANPADRPNRLKPIPKKSEGGRRLMRAAGGSGGGGGIDGPRGGGGNSRVAVGLRRARSGRNGRGGRGGRGGGGGRKGGGGRRRLGRNKVGGSSRRRSRRKRGRNASAGAGHLSVAALAGLLGMPDDSDDNEHMFDEVFWHNYE